MHPRMLALALVGATLLTAAIAAPVPPMSPERAALADARIAPWLRSQLSLDPGIPSSFFVLLEAPADAARPAPASRGELYAHLADAARRAQAPLVASLAARGMTVRPFYLVNALLVTGDLPAAREIALTPGVQRLVGNPLVRGVEAAPPGTAPLAPEAVEWGVTMVRAPEVWAMLGSRGEGVVVATMDTGVQWDHPALAAKYRGYVPGGPPDHRYSWHDATSPAQATPIDGHGHGTHVTGTMVGDGGANAAIGVAPGAQWIACRNMDSQGMGTPARYLECMEWSLAPYPQGGDPLTDGRPDLAPQVANNSWSCPASEGCDVDTLRLAFARLHAAGQLDVAAAGNNGPWCSTVDEPPGSYDEVFSIGAIGSNRAMASFSSRGPVTADGSNRMKPDVVAPGLYVRSSVPNSTYGVLSGTSMASPHVAGVAALLWSKRPILRGLVDLTRCILERSSSPSVTDDYGTVCGDLPITTVPNHVSGWGVVDAYAALTMSNADGDAAPDVCDCAPADASAFAIPPEVAGLAAGAAAISWTSEAPLAGTGTRYDVVRGDIAALRAGNGIAAAACTARNIATPSVADSTKPLPGRAFYFVARGRNACAAGTWGSTSAGAPRSSSACD